MTVTIVLPLPAKELSPNARVHYMKKASATKQYRTQAWAEALVFLNVRPKPRWERAETRTVFYWPDNRRRDRDNAQASIKGIWDGFADAGIVANDSGFVHHAPEMRCDKARPRVEITITEAP